LQRRARALAALGGVELVKRTDTVGQPPSKF
jgi:hypothetical protein